MTPHHFGNLPSGETVDAYTLSNAAGASVEILTYGGIIRRLRVPDRNGRFDDVVLGYDTFESYVADTAYFGAITGRIAGRIAQAHFTLDGVKYALATNDGANHIHGGNVGLNRRLWRATSVAREDGADSLRLTYQSPDGEEGYPGTVDLAVTYTLTSDTALLIETEATTDRATPLSLTNHSYFNLNGEHSRSIFDHELQVHADSFAAADEKMILLGQRLAVAGTGEDFNQPRELDAAILHLFQNHGALYFLPNTNETLRLAARVVSPTSGRVLTVHTTEHCLQFYTGSNLDGSLAGKGGALYGKHAGLCLECEGYPEGTKYPDLGDIILRPGQVAHHATVYAFSAL